MKDTLYNSIAELIKIAGRSVKWGTAEADAFDNKNLCGEFPDNKIAALTEILNRNI
ncbi:MAG: hypothetical protein HC905_15005, partial [Bacteroidales bacterium]|nr:hypothetical protein [Bacteroidales bacterium]